jgi:lysophospholipase L1-like esterase
MWASTCPATVACYVRSTQLVLDDGCGAMKLRLSFLAALLAALIATPGAPAASKASFYLSLGDSLAQGYQPIGGPWSPTGTSGYNHGYADELFKLTRDMYQQLQVVKLGCGGETTTTLRFGGGFCSYEQGSQLDAAAAFLEEHGEEVAFVTIDIGGNDLVSGGGVPAIAANLPVILNTLQKAAAPSVRIVAMNYYDPFVVPVWFGTQSLAALQSEVASIVAFNDFLETIYAMFGVEVADVEAAFSLTDLTIQPSGLPSNVQRTCEWTWMCTVSDIHANSEGYAVIARAFAEELAP